MTFRNLPIATKLGAGFGAVLFVTLLSAGILIWNVSSLAGIEQANTAAAIATDLAERLSSDATEVRLYAYKIVITGSNEDLQLYRAARGQLDKGFEEVERAVGGSGSKFAAQLHQLRTVVVDDYIDQYVEPQVKLALDPKTRQDAAASVVSDAPTRARRASKAKIAAFRDDVSKWSDDLQKQAGQAMLLTQAIVIGAGLLTLGLGIAMAWLISRAISRPLKAMTSTMQALSRGDNSVDVPARDQTDEIGQMAGAVQVFKEAAVEKRRLESEAAEARRLAQAERERVEAEKAITAKQQAQVVDNIATGLNKLAAGDLLQRIEEPFAVEYEGLRRDFNAAVIQLQKTIKEVSLSSGTIKLGTGEISSASDDLSRRTEQQAANLEETASAVAEFSVAMKRAEEGAKHARAVVGTARETTDKSADVISRTIEAMNRIDRESRQISNIIGVIDEIAFQTNLLALNAGVEAARAGESGRGFAVVASEVRSLAQRCAEAAKEIKTLVRSSETQVKEGVELVGVSGKILSQIAGQVGELHVIINDIAASAETQAAGIAEVNVAIAQLDQVTQQNAAMAEEATAAARSLAQEGTDLLRLVGHFSVGASSESADPAAPHFIKGGSAELRLVTPTPMKRVASRGPAAAESWQEF